MLENEVEGGFGMVLQWVVCQVSQTDGMEGMGKDFELRREPATLKGQKEGQQRQEASRKGERSWKEKLDFKTHRAMKDLKCDNLP